MIKYFHELSDEEFQWLVNEKTSYGDLERDFPQPPWCDYFRGLHGQMGCWSLTARDIKSIEDCGNCELRKGVK